MWLVSTDAAEHGEAFGVAEFEDGVEIVPDCTGEEDGVLGDEG